MSSPPVDHQIKILQNHEEELVSCLRQTNLVKFSEELYQSVVISKDTRDQFASLDHDRLDPRLRVRYLLQHVCEGVRHDVIVFHQFLKVLAVLGGRVGQVSRCFNEELDKAGSKLGAGPEDQANDEAGSSKAVVGEIFLSEEDVRILMKILVEANYKWEEIGISLGLPIAVLKDCGSGDTNTVRLYNTLKEWITGKYPSAISCTLKNLKNELADPLVGLGQVAQSLEDRFSEAKRHHFLSTSNTLKGESTLKIVYRSSDTEVADGKSTLLEVQVSPRESVSYQWRKDGQSLLDNSAYSGVHNDILVINLASQGTEGKYTCCVSNGSEEEVNSKAVALTVNYPPEKKHLIQLYSACRELPKDSWPPVGTSTFINLALIKHDKQYQCDYNYSIRGDADDIINSKEKIEYKEVFGEYESRVLVLVEGRPGSGKTTLVHKVARDWAIRGNALRKAKMVFLITLRIFNSSRKDDNLSDLLGLFYRDNEERKLVLRDIERSDGEGVCFIIDGLDEYQPEDESKSVIYQLLYKTYLPETMVIVASRPAATATLKQKAPVTTRIEVLGFTQQQIFEYIDNYPFHSSDISDNYTAPSKLKSYLDSHCNVLHMCYLPVHAAMICFLYQCEKGNIPPTETLIYEQFTRFIILRKLTRSNKKAKLGSLKDLRGKDEEYFSNICHLAFNMTIDSKQVVHENDTQVPLSDGTVIDDVPSLGLVTIDRLAQLVGLQDTYTFLHLTLQEFLTAVHIAKLEEEEQMKIMLLHGGKNQMRITWKFYCGIVNFEGKISRIEMLCRSEGLHAVQCAFESQQQVFCDTLFGKSGALSFSYCTFTPADFNAINYVISTTSQPIMKIDMMVCDLQGDKVGAFLTEVSNNKQQFIRNLQLLYIHTDADGAAALADGLRYCTNLQELNLSHSNIGSDGAAALSDGLKYCTNLQELDLSHSNIGSDGAAALADGIKYCTNLQELYLSRNNIGSDGAAALADGLKYCTNLQKIYLSDIRIGSDGAAALADGLKCCINLQILHLSHNNIGSDGAAALADGLKCCSNLQTLDLSRNNIGPGGAAALSQTLRCDVKWLLNGSPLPE